MGQFGRVGYWVSGGGRPRLTFLKQSCREVSMQRSIHVEKKRAAEDGHQWGGIIGKLHNQSW